MELNLFIDDIVMNKHFKNKIIVIFELINICFYFDQLNIILNI